MPYYSYYFPYTFFPILLVGLYFVLEQYLIKRWQRWLWWIICLIFLFIIGYFAVQEQFLYDFFKGYYYGGRKIIRNPSVLYDESCYGYVNFPLIAYLFTPLAKLPKEIAGKIFYLIGYFFLLPLAYWLIKFAQIKGWSRFIMLILLIISGPLDYSIWLGNITHIIMLFILLSLFNFKLRNELLSGILLGVAGLIKIPLIFPSGYFFIRKNWKVVIGGLLVAGIFLGLSLWIIPLSLNTIWLERCILSIAGNPIPAYNNQSLSGFLARLFMPGNFSWDPILPTLAYKQALSIGNFILYTPVIIVLFFGKKFTKTSSLVFIEFFIILTCSLLTSPISWTHYFIFLLIPIAFYLGSDAHQIIQKPLAKIFLFCSILLLSTPIKLTYALFEQTGEVMFLSAQFIGGLFIYILLLTTWIMIKTSNQLCLK